MRKALVVLSCIALAAAWLVPGARSNGQASRTTLQSYDFGDAEYLASWGGYPTLLAQNGARHEIGGPWLGDATDAPDAEPDGQPETTARGDDLDGNDDEDGAIVSTLFPGFASDIRVEVSGGGGVVEVWIDFNHDRQWQHPTEQVFAGYLPDGVHTFPVLTSTSVTVGHTTARFRISTAGGLTPTGEADDGEVEDHLVEIEAAALDYGDAPDRAGAPLYRTLLVNNGARHLIRGPWLGGVGDGPDGETDGQPHSLGLGDDTDGGWDDEDGVQIPALIPGHPASLSMEVSGGGGYVDGWIDFDNDQSWQHPAEQVVSGYFADGPHTVPITVPGDAAVGQTFGRFRISDEGGLTPVGATDYGEVEDYQVTINPKWEQLPDLDTTGIAITIGHGSGHYISVTDDFECREPGYVTEIEFWVAMYDDYPITFVSQYYVNIYSSVPDPATGGLTTLPDSLLFNRLFGVTQYEVNIWDADIREGWHRGDTFEFPADTSCWHVRIPIEPEDGFFQTGTAENPQVYWLWISAATVATGFELGWKASDEHWGASAMHYSYGSANPPTPYVYPPGHPYAGENIDMAFRVTSQPGLGLDWGDAPDGLDLGSYPTLFIHDGARHIISGPWLGDVAGGPDPEHDGQPEAQALGDDNAVQDDEGGVQIPVLERGESATLTIDVGGGGGYVQGWIDYNGDQDWDGGEMVIAQWLTDGTHLYDILVPSSSVIGESFARFRISTLGDLEPTGRAEDGEVEDYRVTIQDPGTGVSDAGFPKRYGLHPAVPNPFNPATTIRYDVPSPGGKVTIRIFDVAGRLVRTLVDAPQTPGVKQVKWYGLDDHGIRVASGVYFCRMTAAGFEQTRKVALIQ